ncbi:hypothetical protein ACQ143_12230 [Microbacterium sp. MC2]
MDPEDLRGPDVPGRQDLLGWKFRDKYWNDDTSSVVAWASAFGCVFHEQRCSHTPQTEQPTALCRMDRVREVFATERLKGTVRYFGFCGHCLAERVANYGWQPSSSDLAQLNNMTERLNDVRILRESPITWSELITRMKRYGSGDLTKKELKRLLEYYRHNRGDEEEDLTRLVIL